MINTQFQVLHCLCTRHCSIVSFSSTFIFSDKLVSESDRIIHTKVKHPYNAFCTFLIACTLCPAASGQQRQQLFDHVLELLHNQDLDSNLDRLFITGDFIYFYSRPHLSSYTSLQWISFLDNQFCNVLMNYNLHELPTFRRKDTTYSVIDYIFVNQAFRTQVTDSSLHKLDAS